MDPHHHPQGESLLPFEKKELNLKRLTVVFMVVAAFMLSVAGAAQAGPAVQNEKATGSIVMSNPKQAIDFNVFESPMKGNVTYTNFEASSPGSGVWVPAGTFDVGFGVDPDPRSSPRTVSR